MQHTTHTAHAPHRAASGGLRRPSQRLSDCWNGAFVVRQLRVWPEVKPGAVTLCSGLARRPAYRPHQCHARGTTHTTHTADTACSTQHKHTIRYMHAHIHTRTARNTPHNIQIARSGTQRGALKRQLLERSRVRSCLRKSSASELFPGPAASACFLALVCELQCEVDGPPLRRCIPSSWRVLAAWGRIFSLFSPIWSDSLRLHPSAGSGPQKGTHKGGCQCCFGRKRSEGLGSGVGRDFVAGTSCVLGLLFLFLGLGARRISCCK